MSLPSVAPREPPQFLSTSSECKRTVGRLCLSLCIRFLHRSAKEGPITIPPTISVSQACCLVVRSGGHQAVNVGVSNIHLQFIPLLQNVAQEVAMAVVRVENRVEKICATLYVSIYHSWLRLFKKCISTVLVLLEKKVAGLFPGVGCVLRGGLW